MRANPDVKAFYANNDTMALGVVEAVVNAGKQDEVIVVGTDGVPDAIQSVRDGTWMPPSPPFRMRWAAPRWKSLCASWKVQDVPGTVVSQQELITADNVDEYYPES